MTHQTRGERAKRMTHHSGQISNRDPALTQGVVSLCMRLFRGTAPSLSELRVAFEREMTWDGS